MKKSQRPIGFYIIDPKTGEEPIMDRNHVLKEKWVKESMLVWCDIDQFVLSEDGSLYLIDDCNNMALVPEGRFEIVFTEKEVRI